MFYRPSFNRSRSSSIFEDVEMAHEEVGRRDAQTHPKQKD